jgi:hypothetical protein
MQACFDRGCESQLGLGSGWFAAFQRAMALRKNRGQTQGPRAPYCSGFCQVRQVRGSCKSTPKKGLDAVVPHNN